MTREPGVGELRTHPFERGGLLSTTCARPDCLQAPTARIHLAAVDQADKGARYCSTCSHLWTLHHEPDGCQADGCRLDHSGKPLASSRCGEYRSVEQACKLDVDRLREAARRARLPHEVTVADIENLAREYEAGR